jgi:hypothetical protein
LSAELGELVVRAATVSGRAAAREQSIGLTVMDGAVHAIDAAGRHAILCSGVHVAAWAPWTALPKALGVVNASGAVVLTTADSTHVFPIDEWWIEPAPPATPRQAIASSGFDDLAERLGTPIAFDPDATASLVSAANAVVHVPRSRRAAETSRRRTIAVAVLLAVVLLPLPLTVTAFGRGWAEALTAVGWACVVASAVGLANVVLGVIGRRNSVFLPGREPTLRPSSGPRWFRNNASISVSGGVLSVDDGRWRTVLLATPLSTSSRSAVVRARLVRGGRPRVVLIDGADVVRAELPLRFWPESGLDALLSRMAIVRDPGTERRSLAALRLDPDRGATVPGSSLVAWTSLGVAPLTPLALSVVLQLMVAAFARIGGPLPQAAALTLGIASVVVLLAIVGTELGRRLPWVPSRPRGFRPSRDFAFVVGGFAVLGVVAAVLVVSGDPGAAGYAIGLAVTSVPVQWVVYRHRSIRAQRGVLGLLPWLRAGCPPTDQHSTAKET